jgi:hypothetical protein
VDEVMTVNINLTPKTLDQVKFYVPPHQEDIFKNALQDSDLCDLMICVDSCEIPVSKFVLMVHSPVFKAMFKSEMTESATNKLVIADFSEETVRSMLRCLYDQQNMFDKMKQHGEQLLLIANKYEIKRLMSFAESFFEHNFSVENVLRILTIADTISNQAIKTHAMEFLIENRKNVFVEGQNFVEVLGVSLCNDIFLFVGKFNGLK